MTPQLNALLKRWSSAEYQNVMLPGTNMPCGEVTSLIRESLGLCSHNCDEGGICLAELSGYPESCPQPPIGWRDMATAPRDGTRILVKTVTFGWDGDKCRHVRTGTKAVEARWAKGMSTEETWIEWCGNDRSFTTNWLEPLVWMPLPPD